LTARLLETTRDEGSIIGFKSAQGGVYQFATRDDDDVEARDNLVATKHFSYESLRSIPDNRTTDFARGGDAQPPERPLVGQEEHGAITTRDSNAVFIDALEFRAVPDTFVRAERRQTCLTRSTQ